MTKTSSYIKSELSDESDGSGYSCLTLNLPENSVLNVKSIGIERCSPDKKERLHTFECSTMHFILSGKGVFDDIELSRHEGFIVRENKTARYCPDRSEPWTYCWINFDGSAADELLKSVGLTQDKCAFSCKEVDAVAGVIERALNQDYSRTSASLYLDGALLEIFAVLASNEHDSFAGDWESVMRRRVSEAIEYISVHYAEKSCLDDLARVQGVNKRYLSRLFSQYSDNPPQSHIIRARIEQAKRLLRTSAVSITAVAASVGYADVMQFSKIFKKHTGISPSAYRSGGRDKLGKFE